jgi:hypothetical protein
MLERMIDTRIPMQSRNAARRHGRPYSLPRVAVREQIGVADPSSRGGRAPGDHGRNR